MHFKTFYLGCLAQASYLIGSNGEAAVIDPQRDIEQYVTEAESHGLRIKYVIETHLHADFVSGHRELAERTGAEIVFGRRAGATFPHRAVADGDEIKVGTLRLRFLETPGHTPESISILLIDPTAGSRPLKVFTGDTLFIGDVGRPDLVSAKGHTAEEMAGMLHDSLHNKLLALADEVEVCPAHGAGSLCGRSISREIVSTIGAQRTGNYALQAMPRDEFIRMMTSDLPEVPAYFPYDAELNRTGPGTLSTLPEPKSLSPREVFEKVNAGALPLDIRAANDYCAGHIHRSLAVGLNGQFASWAGTFISPDAEVILVADGIDQVREAVTRLARVGLENVAGFLDGGIAAWKNAGYEVAEIPQMAVEELGRQMDEGGHVRVLDVRRPGEYQAGHAPRVENIPLDTFIKRQFNQVSDQPFAVMCQSGYRSVIGVSLLERFGIGNLVNVTGGFQAWNNAGLRVAQGE